MTRERTEEMPLRVTSIEIDYDGDLWIVKFDGEVIEAFCSRQEAIESLADYLKQHEGKSELPQ